MLILRQFPDPKRLEPLERNAAFRKAFYARWGHEHCMVLGRSRRVEYPLFEQRLSIKVASGGRERYRLTAPNREVDVDDDNYLIVNDGRSYGSRIASDREVESFSIFFRPGFAQEAEAALQTPAARALDGGEQRAGSPEFHEFLQPHDRYISPVVQFIRHHVRAGFDDPQWYEEQLHFLLVRMLNHRDRQRRRAAELPAMRRTTRDESFRRVMRAVDYIESNFERELSLGQLAAEACLSKFHFLRLFQQVTGVTPYAWMLRKRVLAAGRLIATRALTLDEIALQVGFRSRSSLFRQARRWMACSPRELGQARLRNRSR